VNPSGKLPITYPRWPNRLFTYDHKVFEGEDSREGKMLDTPQFEFGYGLSYTNFVYTDLLVYPTSDSGKRVIHVEVTVKNDGEREGKEVTQLYVSESVASITQPLKRLKRFAKVSLRAGESRRILFELTPEDLSFIGPENRPIIEPGVFNLSIGGLTQSIDWK